MKKPDKNKCDFAGWVTKNDVECGDGRIIRQNAFAHNDGMVVPLVWNHQHGTNQAVLGHVLLENRPEGVYGYGFFNNTQAGADAKEQVIHGDVTSLSILANKLVQEAKSVVHGCIREVSLVLAGANPGAFIESVLSHGEPIDEYEDEGIIFSGDEIIIHSEGMDDSIKTAYDENGNPIFTYTDDDLMHTDDTEDNDDPKEDPTIGEILESMNEEQKAAVGYLLDEMAKELKNEDKSDEKESQESDNNEKKGDNMSHSIFESSKKNNETENVDVITHADVLGIFKEAKQLGSLKEALKQFEEAHGGVLAHALDTTGLTTSTGMDSAKNNYGVKGLEMLVPDYKAGSTQPQFISRDMEWVSKVLNSVGRTPFKRIKTLLADITEDEARAKGYIKGKQKKEEVFSLLKRTTDPTTIYKKQKLDRDDILDIEDFDIVMWMKQEMDVMMNEEKARAILIGDGRLADHEDKIDETKIRPIATDVPLFNVSIQIPTSGSSEAEIAKNTIDGIIKGRKKYKGSGNPVFYTTADAVTEMLLLEDKVGHKLYKTVEELKTALRVSDIVEVEPMEGKKIKVEGATKEDTLIGVIVNLTDYRIGANKPKDDLGMLEDFDIDYNQYKYLTESRMSGALVKPFSALTIVRDSTKSPTGFASSGGSNGGADANSLLGG